VRIGVHLHLKSNSEPTFREVDPEDLLEGSDIKEALNKLGITENNFVQGFFEENLLKVSFKSYDDFLNTAWYVRQRLHKIRRGRHNE